VKFEYASDARMPQLKKVILAIGNTLIYKDTYEQALGELSGLMQGGTAGAVQSAVGAASPSGGGTPPADLSRLKESIQSHLRRARELAAQGKWAEAGKELDAIEVAAQK
jgi:uncharacterized membrane protein (UPF0182 family)